MKSFREWNLSQEWLLPPSVLDFVPPEHPAHFVRDFVRDLVRESLDLKDIYASYTEERGYPPYHPAIRQTATSKATTGSSRWIRTIKSSWRMA